MNSSPKKMAFVCTGFLPDGNDPFNELGNKVGMRKGGAIVFIRPEDPMIHLQPIPSGKNGKVQWDSPPPKFPKPRTPLTNMIFPVTAPE